MPRGVAKKRDSVYVCTTSFASDIGDAQAGQTFVREGHEMLKRYPEWFQEVSAAGGVEDASASPEDAA